MRNQWHESKLQTKVEQKLLAAIVYVLRYFVALRCVCSVRFGSKIRKSRVILRWILLSTREIMWEKNYETTTHRSGIKSNCQTNDVTRYWNRYVSCSEFKASQAAICDSNWIMWNHRLHESSFDSLKSLKYIFIKFCRIFKSKYFSH